MTTTAAGQTKPVNELIRQLVSQAQQDKLSRADTVRLLVAKLKEHEISISTIYRHLPADLKDPVKRNNRLSKGAHDASSDIDQMTQATTQPHEQCVTLAPVHFVSLYTLMRSMKPLSLLVTGHTVTKIEVPKI
jgi:hypothetical protein